MQTGWASPSTAWGPRVASSRISTPFEQEQVELFDPRAPGGDGSIAAAVQENELKVAGPSGFELVSGRLRVVPFEELAVGLAKLPELVGHRVLRRGFRVGGGRRLRGARRGFVAGRLLPRGGLPRALGSRSGGVRGVRVTAGAE